MITSGEVRLYARVWCYGKDGSKLHYAAVESARGSKLQYGDMRSAVVSYGMVRAGCRRGEGCALFQQ
eukprot:1727149-Rhodomonas_salina.2